MPKGANPRRLEKIDMHKLHAWLHAETYEKLKNMAGLRGEPMAKVVEDLIIGAILSPTVTTCDGGDLT